MREKRKTPLILLFLNQEFVHPSIDRQKERRIDSSHEREIEERERERHKLRRVESDVSVDLSAHPLMFLKLYTFYFEDGITSSSFFVLNDVQTSNQNSFSLLIDESEDEKKDVRAAALVKTSLEMSELSDT